ncbi:tRNA-specific 2-thiouridylase MnmA [Candidatus Omnitrophus magneticus]|uniref:tRNA-specific 2-thiouridylase MnmA n=1 Tax=Candidatus Omnitrophus magneticus TaxID=1609969 RepID=A0A0F0CWI8_9BACT|nr:tRNA-specific 2-thiouridylase MnmA [Candidatus Omnitrophus magneticus]
MITKISDKNIMNKKVLVAMSGGVDSSIAAYLLLKDGYDVVGVTMCLGVKSDNIYESKCCGMSAIEDAKKVARHLNIPHYVLDFSREMEEFVIRNFVSRYSIAMTPNPCVECNKHLKFKKLMDYARQMGFFYLATGHYAAISEENNNFFLKRPKDAKKDQTYFLYCVKKEYLKNILFPLADYTKNEVREIAEKNNIPVAFKAESQDVCFIPDGTSYKDFVIARTGAAIEGDIVDLNGKILGRHKGIINYTLGQRTGLGISAGTPIYVVKIDHETNVVIVGGKESLYSKELVAGSLNFLVDNFPMEVFAKIRYGSKSARASVFIEEDNARARVVFDEPQLSITPGQSIVFYDGDKVVGGGIIEKFFPTK